MPTLLIVILFIYLFFGILVPGIPELNQFCNVILWRQPNVTGGILTGYDLMIGSTEIRHFGRNENFYITTDAQKQANVLVQVISK